MFNFSWLGWILHVGFGALVGGASGLALATGRRSRGFGGYTRGLEDHPPAVWACALGGALLVAGVAGEYGDRLWLRRGVLDNPRAPSHPVARVINKIMIAAGLLSTVLGFVLYFNR